MSLVVPTVDPSVLVELARARRRRRIANIDVFEVLYRAYILAIVVGIAVVEVGGLAADAEVKGHQLVELRLTGLRRWGAHWRWPSCWPCARRPGAVR